MKIKICGLFRKEDIDYINEARPDYIGFVFAESRRQISRSKASRLRSRLAQGIRPVGVFVDAPIGEITGLFSDGIIEIAQLHGSEDEAYIAQLKRMCEVEIIKTIIYPLCGHCEMEKYNNADYYLIDSGAGSGKTFDWNSLTGIKINKPWFLAGGINSDNMEKAISLNPFAIDISSGAETNGIKDREKIIHLSILAKKGKSI